MSDLAIPIAQRLVRPEKFAHGDHFPLLRFAVSGGIFSVTFEQVRPFGIEITDYFFFLSFLILLPSIRGRVLDVRGSGILLAGALIFSGADAFLDARRGLDRPGREFHPALRALRIVRASGADSFETDSEKHAIADRRNLRELCDYDRAGICFSGNCGFAFD